MQELGKEDGIEYDFGGDEVANTLHAHRVSQFLQDKYSPEHALAALSFLYEQYFSQREHPSSASTLVTACLAAGLSQHDADALVHDEGNYLRQMKAAIQEQAGNGVDSVPYVVFEGKRRKFTLVGAKSGEEYGKVLGQVVKEAG